MNNQKPIAIAKYYKNSQYLFIVLAIICFFGFYKTYFGSFTSFSSSKFVIHCHAATITLWLFVLIIQPILVQKKKIALHRLVGRTTNYLFPIVVLFLLLMEKSLYEKSELAHLPHDRNLAALFGPFTNTLPFTLFYILGIKYKKMVGIHARYMVGTGLMLLSSALWRIFYRWFYIDIGMSFQYALWTTLIITIALIAYDRWKGFSITKNPFTLIALIHLVTNVSSIFIPFTSYWQSFSQWIVTNIF